MQHTLIDMLGTNLDDVAQSSFLKSLLEEPTIERIEDRSYMELPASGLAFVASLSRRVIAIQLHAEGYQEYTGFARPIPDGISFSHSRRAVQRRLVKPSATGGGNFHGKASVWDRFDKPEYSLHVQYADNDASINLVTIMRPEFVPT